MKATVMLSSLLLGLTIHSQSIASDTGAIVGSAVGSAIGAAIGHDVNGRHGAIVGAAIGGATGAAIGSNQQKSTTVVQERVVVQQPMHRVIVKQPVERVVYVSERGHRHDNGKHRGWYKHQHKHKHYHDD